MEEDFNILLLGETGVGKSTFINAFINYIMFGSFDDAKSGNLEIMIPTIFTVTDEDYNLIEIKTDFTDLNEQVESGGTSATQGCKDYVFQGQGRTVRLIDTPGIGDTRGVDQDKKNLENILNHIGQHRHLNGICILLKPSNARLTVTFRFCIQEFLSHLHKSAKDNIVFCFTNARQTFYRPGDTLPSLKEQLETSNVEIITNKSTLYCFDNESFRFLIARTKGIKFSEDDEQNFAESWKRSVNETKRLFKHFESCTPHKIKDTLSLNNARRIVNQLSKPLADIDKEINVQIKNINDRKKGIQSGDLESSLYKTEYKTVKFSRPRIMCSCERAESYCFEYFTSGNGLFNRIVSWGSFSLKLIMNEGCDECKCKWNAHTTKTYVREAVQVEDEEVKKMIENNESIRKMLEKLEEESKNLNDEKKIISDINFEFIRFLIQNSITSFNDAYIDYLDYLIKDAKNKKSVENYDNEIVEKLEESRDEYKKKITPLKEEMKKGISLNAISPEEITKLEKELYELPIKGQQLKELKRIEEQGQESIGKSESVKRYIKLKMEKFFKA